MEKLEIPLETKKCERCGKKVEILVVTRGGSEVKSAPCKHCSCENFISKKVWERGPAEVDLADEKEVIQHIRDLLNLSDLLENGLDAELLTFIRKLKEAGYTRAKIHQFITYGGYNSRFEQLTDGCGERIVPRALPNRGNQKEWRKIKREHN